MRVFPPYWLQVFNGISTTNLRIFITIVLAVGTGFDYWIWNDAPDPQWLIFLGALAGIDVAQFASKRATDSRRHAPNNVEPKEVTQSTDVQEISQEKG
jgi:hypothetical protein